MKTQLLLTILSAFAAGFLMTIVPVAGVICLIGVAFNYRSCLYCVNIECSKARIEENQSYLKFLKKANLHEDWKKIWEAQ